MRWEYLDDDVNKYADVLGNPRRVQTLHEVTAGEPERSRIYREYLAGEGIEQEMLVALASRTGECWGTVRLNRLQGQPEFDDGELRLMAAVAPDLAEGIRRGLIVGEATDPDLPDAPGLIIFDADGEIVSVSIGANGSSDSRVDHLVGRYRPRSPRLLRPPWRGRAATIRRQSPGPWCGRPMGVDFCPRHGDRDGTGREGRCHSRVGAPRPHRPVADVGPGLIAGERSYFDATGVAAQLGLTG